MTDKELEQQAEKEAYKAIGFSKFHMKFAPFGRWILFFLGLCLMVAGGDNGNESPKLIISGAL